MRTLRKYDPICGYCYTMCCVPALNGIHFSFLLYVFIFSSSNPLFLQKNNSNDNLKSDIESWNNVGNLFWKIMISTCNIYFNASNLYLLVIYQSTTCSNIIYDSLVLENYDIIEDRQLQRQPFTFPEAKGHP